MASDDEDNSIQEVLLVYPTGECYLVNHLSGVFYWPVAVETNSQPPRMLNLGNDYMEARLTGGRITLHHWNADTERWTRVQLNPERITRFLRRTYGVNFTFNTPEETPYNIDYTSGLTGPTWTLEISRYKAFFPLREPLLEDADRAPCCVYHTFDMPRFLLTCNSLNVTTFPNGQTIQDLTSLESINNNKKGVLNPLQVLGVGQGSTRVYRGTIVSLNVAVKVIQRTGDFSEMYNNLWLVNACDNIVRFYGAEVHESSCLLAFEECGQTLHGFVHIYYFRNSLETTTWSTVMRGIVRGLHHLHRLAHRNLNPHNILLTEDYVPRICGMSNSRSLDDESQAWDLHCLGEVLRFCFTLGEYNFNDSNPNYDYNVHLNGFGAEESEEFVEVYDVIQMLLNNNEPGLLRDVYYHPRLWDCTKSLQFLRDVSDTLQATINDPNFKFLTRQLETIKTKVIPKDHRGRRRWKACFKDKLVKHMEANRYGSTKYDDRSVYHLLRFIRNYIYARGLDRRCVQYFQHS